MTTNNKITKKVRNQFANGNAKLGILMIAFIAFVITGNQFATASLSEKRVYSETRAAAVEVRKAAYGYYYDDDSGRATTPVNAATRYMNTNPDGKITVEVLEREDCFTVSAIHESGETVVLEEVCEGAY